MLPTEAAVQEWCERLDALVEKNRLSEAGYLHDWLNLTFHGGSFILWLAADDPQPYGSWGNGSAMRVSPVGFAFDTKEEAIIAFLDSDAYEDAVRNAVSLGGDSDTLARITGGIAEAYYKGCPGLDGRGLGSRQIQN